MNATDLTIDDAEDSAFHVVDNSPFFAPVATDLVDGLLGQYKAARVNIDKLAAIVTGGEFGNVVHYFISGNCGDDQLHRSLYVDKLFNVDGAVGSLNSSYWSKALALTDVYNCMPQERKNEWNKQLKNPAGIKAKENRWDTTTHTKVWESEPLPDFEDATVRATIGNLLNARAQFMAERVDGIFRALSGSHVTNAPEAFGKRMIIAHIIGSYGSADWQRVGYLHDLRVVIAKFMGREEPSNQSTTNDLVDTAKRQHGQWIVADGGALKIRVYKIGTAHLEVHPDMAWRLNSILAHMHPLAIPAEFRQKPKRRTKAVAMMSRPLPFAVLELIAGMREHIEYTDKLRDRTRRIPMTRQFEYSGDRDKHLIAEATRRGRIDRRRADGPPFHLRLRAERRAEGNRPVRLHPGHALASVLPHPGERRARRGGPGRHRARSRLLRAPGRPRRPGRPHAQGPHPVH